MEQDIGLIGKRCIYHYDNSKPVKDVEEYNLYEKCNGEECVVVQRKCKDFWYVEFKGLHGTAQLDVFEWELEVIN